MGNPNRCKFIVRQAAEARVMGVLTSLYQVAAQEAVTLLAEAKEKVGDREETPSTLPRVDLTDAITAILKTI